MRVALLLASFGVALAGCTSKPRPSEVLVCKSEGRETFRSEPESCWYTSNGTWRNCGWTRQYRQSLTESCYTEAAR